jgi:predicted nucleic acid-binding protein
VLLDTTCLAAYLDAGESVHPIARHVLDAFVASGRNPAVLSMVTVMEILVRPLRSQPDAHRTVLSFLKRHPNLTPEPTTITVALEAATLRADHRLRPPDALIVGTALAAGVHLVVTNDHEWRAKLHAIEERVLVVTLSDYLE